YPEHAVG
ncbi:hypothetical protein D030_4101B, partial [Vibrio parahaemolyticus AQ3810]